MTLADLQMQFFVQLCSCFQYYKWLHVRWSLCNSWALLSSSICCRWKPLGISGAGFLQVGFVTQLTLLLHWS